MCRKAILLTAALLFAVSAPIEAQELDGNWKLTHLSEGTTESTDFIVNLKTVDGKITGKVVNRSYSNEKDLLIYQDGESLRIEGPPRTDNFNMKFQALIPKTPPKRWLGAYTRGKYTYPAWLTPVTKEDISPFGERSTHICPPLQEAAQIKKDLEKQAPKSGFKKTAAERLAYEKKKAEIAELVKKQTAVHYRKVLEKFPEDPGLFYAVQGLFRSAKTNGATLDEVKNWGAAADKLAKAYGPRFEAGFAANAVEALDGQDAYASVAVDYARRVERALSPKAPLQEQIDGLTPLARVLRSAGKAEDAKPVEAKIEKMEGQLDRDYLATLPAVKPFAGRKGKSDRVVLLEQFFQFGSGSEDLDRSCSLLLKSYHPGEVAVVQYPVVDRGPLSCPDGAARYSDYRKAYPAESKRRDIGFLNGHPTARFGGTKDYEKTFQALRQSIDPLLEEDAGAKLVAKATRNGDKIDIQIDVALKRADEDKKLRIVLVEQFIRYPRQAYLGSPGARVHHHIVRACPGGVAGKSLTDAVSKHSVSVDTVELRKQLAKYIEDGRVRLQMPTATLLKLENLRVIAFVQDD
ncbi:MAG TPA: hypothetical protein VFE62_14805, partial [Gemmataceae bacterium]|nr:hypothetical protein [Gemmataceae bacterium]